jgi:hypothetical protein
VVSLGKSRFSWALDVVFEAAMGLAFEVDGDWVCEGLLDVAVSAAGCWVGLLVR